MKELDTQKLTTDELFKALPSFINISGKVYHFELIKGRNNIIIWYKVNDNEGGEYLHNTHRTGKTLKIALKKTLNWLIKFGYYDLESENILFNMIKQSKKQQK